MFFTDGSLRHVYLQYSTSCEAADVGKPKVRLCEPGLRWVNEFVGAAEGDLTALVLTRNPEL